MDDIDVLREHRALLLNVLCLPGWDDHNQLAREIYDGALTLIDRQENES